jgi:hypothetical protein
VTEAKRKEKLLEPESQAESSGAKRRKREREETPDVFMEGDPPIPNNNTSPLPHLLPLTPSTLLRADKVKLNFRLYFIYLLCLFLLFKILCIFIVFVYDFMHETLLLRFK